MPTRVTGAQEAFPMALSRARRILVPMLIAWGTSGCGNSNGSSSDSGTDGSRAFGGPIAEDGSASDVAHPMPIDSGYDAPQSAEGGDDGPSSDSPSQDGQSGDGSSQDGPSSVGVFTMDTPNVVRRSNIVLGKANALPQDSMALGNGTLGAALWAANGFTAQLNRADTYPDRKAVGQVVIPGLAHLTGASDFSGHVDLYDAMLTESGGGMAATAFVRADTAEMIVEVTGADPNSMQTVQIKLRSGRSPRAAAAGNLATLAETWPDSSGLGASGQTFGVLSAVTVGGRNARASVVDPLTVQVAFQPNADGSFRVVIAAPAWTGGDAMSTAAALLGSDATALASDLRAGHLAWWHDYWGRAGLVKMVSSDGSADYFENLRTIYLYLTAAEERSTFPGSQAGLADLFDFLQDQQPWFPAGFWFWNRRMLVAANMTSGVFDMNNPTFNLYRSNLVNMQAWTNGKMGGRSGICVPETMRFNGNGYWVGGESNASCDQNIPPSFNALTITSGAEVGLWVWQQYLMTGDRAFLSANYPLMSESARFLLAYATLGSDGLLHTIANAHETQWQVHDPVTDIVAMQALFEAVVSAAGVLGTDAALVTQLQGALTKLPPLPRTDAATHKQLFSPANDAAGQDVIALSYEPSAMQHNGENLDLEAVWPYGLIGDTGTLTALATRTYQHRMFVDSPDWTFDALQAARLGLAAEVARALTSVTQKYQSFVNGLGLLGGGANSGSSEPYIEQLGVLTAAVNEALVQDYDGLLRIAPAWPPRWDAAGTVYVQGNSKVDVQVQGGAVVIAILEAGSTGSIQIRNPWPGRAAVVIDGGMNVPVVPATSANTLVVPTLSGHWYALVPAATATALPHVQVTGTAAVRRKTLGSVGIGL
jgi:glycosyl hydrolase family 95